LLLWSKAGGRSSGASPPSHPKKNKADRQDRQIPKKAVFLFCSLNLDTTYPTVLVHPVKRPIEYLTRYSFFVPSTHLFDYLLLPKDPIKSKKRTAFPFRKKVRLRTPTNDLPLTLYFHTSILPHFHTSTFPPSTHLAAKKEGQPPHTRQFFSALSLSFINPKIHHTRFLFTQQQQHQDKLTQKVPRNQLEFEVRSICYLLPATSDVYILHITLPHGTPYMPYKPYKPYKPHKPHKPHTHTYPPPPLPPPPPTSGRRPSFSAIHLHEKESPPQV
jgi:hypothetical protein